MLFGVHLQEQSKPLGRGWRGPSGGRSMPAGIYDRSLLKAGHRVPGPAIVCQMDTTTLILPGHTGEIDRIGNILIRPNT